MEKLLLPNVQAEHKNGQIVVTHKKSGMTTTVSEKRLETWLLGLLRQELSQPKEVL